MKYIVTLFVCFITTHVMNAQTMYSVAYENQAGWQNAAKKHLLY